MKFYDSPEAESTGNNAKCGAFYRTVSDERDILLRIKDAMDTSQPSDNAVAASNLFRLGALLDNASYTRLAQETVNAFEAEILQYPYLFPGMLTNVVASKLGVKRLVSVGEQGDGLSKYYLSPRGTISTLLFAKSNSKLAKPQSNKLLNEHQPGLYTIEADEQLVPVTA